MACEDLRTALTALLEKRSYLQAELHTAAPAQKPPLISAIAALNIPIGTKRRELGICVAQNPPLNPFHYTQLHLCSASR